MRLIHNASKKPLVEFLGKKTVFHNKYLEDQMRLLGVSIPPGLRSHFEGKDFVYLRDPTFQKAFREVYYLTSMDSQEFTWEE